LEADLKATKRSLTTAERELEELKSERLLDSGKILKKQDEIRGIKAGLDALEELIKEMF
jgi:hypothetical protein